MCISFIRNRFGGLHKCKLTKCWVGKEKMAYWQNGKITEWQVEKIASWQYVKLTKCQVDEMASWQNGILTKWQVDKMASLQSGKLRKWKFGNMSRWQNVKLTIWSGTLNFYFTFNQFFVLKHFYFISFFWLNTRAVTFRQAAIDRMTNVQKFTGGKTQVPPSKAAIRPGPNVIKLFTAVIYENSL